ncbi:MAG: ABC transporter permease [Chloroflexi bacterium]|nr:ABC transporter permease [Chloroflexota bacterium]
MQLLIIGLSNGAVIALNAIGFTLIYGITQTINLAHGDLFALTSVLVTTIVTYFGLYSGVSPLLLVGGLTLILGAAITFGWWLSVGIERAAFAPFRKQTQRVSGLAPLIATLGISFILYQAALTWRLLLPNWRPGEHRSVPGIPEFPRDSIPELLPKVDLLQWLGLKGQVLFTLKDLLVLLLAVGGALGVRWFLQRTKIGKAIRACAESPELARLCGINPDVTIRRAFAVGGALAGIAAFVFALYYTHPYTQYGAQSSLVAFAVAILGGIGNPIGALFSGLLFGVFAALSDYFLGGQWTPALLQLLLIVLLLLRPNGFTKGAEEASQQPTTRDAMTASPTAMRSSFATRLLWLLLVVGLLYPVADDILGLHWQTTMTSIGIFVLLTLGLNLLLGFAGLLDLGYATSFAIGGYTAALITDRWGNIGSALPQPMNFLIVLACSALAAGLFGAFNGLLTLRLRNDYLAIVTLALSQVIRQLIINFDKITGGGNGISALPAPNFFNYSLQTPLERYYLVLAVIVVVAFASQRLLHSRMGRAWLASSEDELAAASSGVALARTKTQAFALGTALAGIAGALYASCFTYVDPEMIDFRLSAMVLAMLILGGTGSIAGAIIGAIVIAGYDRLVIPQVGDWLAHLQQTGHLAVAAAFDVRGLSYLSFGLALYLTVLLRARRSANV